MIKEFTKEELKERECIYTSKELEEGKKYKKTWYGVTLRWVEELKEVEE